MGREKDCHMHMLNKRSSVKPTCVRHGLRHVRCEVVMKVKWAGRGTVRGGRSIGPSWLLGYRGNGPQDVRVMKWNLGRRLRKLVVSLDRNLLRLVLMCCDGLNCLMGWFVLDVWELDRFFRFSFPVWAALVTAVAAAVATVVEAAHGDGEWVGDLVSGWVVGAMEGEIPKVIGYLCGVWVGGREGGREGGVGNLVWCCRIITITYIVGETQSSKVQKFKGLELQSVLAADPMHVGCW